MVNQIKIFTQKSYISLLLEYLYDTPQTDVTDPERDVFKHKTYLLSLWFKGKETAEVVGTYRLFNASVVRTQSAQDYI